MCKIEQHNYKNTDYIQESTFQLVEVQPTLSSSYIVLFADRFEKAVSYNKLQVVSPPTMGATSISSGSTFPPWSTWVCNQLLYSK